jgi:hypothetical protein
VADKVEWYPGELYPQVGFIVTDPSRPAKRVVALFNQQRTAEQWIKKGKYPIEWSQLHCRKFRHIEVRLQLYPRAYNLVIFVRILALLKDVEHCSLPTLQEKPVKILPNIVLLHVQNDGGFVTRSGISWH